MSKKPRAQQPNPDESAESLAREPSRSDPDQAPEPLEADRADPERTRLTAELEELQDRHLRLAAEFDNFRKRTARERGEIRTRAQAELLQQVISFLDDLDRVAELDPAQVSAKDVIDGVALADRTLRRQLEAAGLQRVGAEGEAFDPNVMEAMGSVPIDDPARDHTVAMVFQPGYRFAGHLVRPARVQVHVYQDGAATSG